MDTCPTCGARLKTELEWCWQCYTPLRLNDPPPRPAAPLEPTVTLEMPIEMLRGTAETMPVGPRVRRAVTACVIAFVVVTDLLFLPVIRLMLIYALFTSGLSGYVLYKLWSPAPIKTRS